MKKIIKTTLSAFIFIFCAAQLSGFSFTYPEKFTEIAEVLDGISGELAAEDDDQPVSQARFYFEMDNVTVFIPFENTDGSWKTVIPYKVLENRKSLEYFVELIDAEGVKHRLPAEGFEQIDLQQLLPTPGMNLIYPKIKELTYGIPQVVLIGYEGLVNPDKLKITLNGTDIEYRLDETLIRLVITPSEEEVETLEISVTAEDNFGSAIEERYQLTVLPPKKVEWLDLAFGGYGEAEIAYEASLSSGTLSQLGTDLASFTPIEHGYALSIGFGGDAYGKLGPLELVLDYQQAYSGNLEQLWDTVSSDILADAFDVYAMLNPWNFDAEFSFPQGRRRTYDSGGSFNGSISLFTDFLIYEIGDQSVTFQDQTVSSLNFRGVSLSLNTPILWVKAAKGLTKLGKIGAAYPQNLFGVQVGVGKQDHLWLQTNLSFISDYQGRYTDLGDPEKQTIEELFSLDGVRSKESFSAGLGLGVESKVFSLKADGGLTLYVDDTSTLINLDVLSDQLAEGFDIDTGVIEPYLAIVNDIYSIFPIFDYFPISNGIAAGALAGFLAMRDGLASAGTLWGLTYAIEMELPTFGLSGFLIRSDKSYKSLGASVSSDIFTYGGELSRDIGGFAVDASFSMEENNMKDLLMQTIIPLTGLMDAPAAPTTEEKLAKLISSKKLEAEGNIGLPQIPIIGKVSMSYLYEHGFTNAADLTVPETETEAAYTLAESDKNNEYVAHIAGAVWTPQVLDLSVVRISMKGDGEIEWIQDLIVSGVVVTEPTWEVNYTVGGGADLKLFGIGIDGSYERGWSSIDDSNYEHEIGFGLDLPIPWLDSISFDGEYAFTETKQTREMLSQEYKIGFEISKAIGIFELAAACNGSYFDDLLDDAKDKTDIELTITGAVQL